MARGIRNMAGLPFWPLMLSEAEAAIYTGLSLAKFQRAVADGTIPQPKRYQGTIRWCRPEIDRQFDGSTPVEVRDEDRLSEKLDSWTRP